jgi:DNA-binding winged helix-turn-helix (wHTH) protein/tetratricopeptide (TPR) repeat protein
MTKPHKFRFGAYRLDTAARELRRDGELLPLPRRVFDALAHLVEQRERAVSHDELIATLWGRTHVANSQVSQLIMQVRRAIGDDSNTQGLVRTVPGFGYRWITATEELATRGDEADPATDSGTEPALPGATSPEHPHDGAVPAGNASRVTDPARWRPITWLLASCAALLLVFVLALHRHDDRSQPEADAQRAPSGKAIVVLPLDVEAAEKVDAAWVRLGGMDLIANRLRDAGLPVPPSDSVVAALHATAGLPEPRRLGELKRLLGAAMLVQGTASHSASGWAVELGVLAGAATQRRIESRQREIVGAARVASDLLLAALGHAPPVDDDDHAELGDYLQRARAALLAGELDTARSILTRAPEELRKDPEVRCELARIEFHARNLDEAQALADALLADPAILARPRLHVRALRTRGWIAAMREDEDWAAAERYLDRAVIALDDAGIRTGRGKLLAERGLARTFLRRFEEATLDLGEARAELEIAGDRRGLGEMNNYLGQLELMHGRVAESVAYFRAAADSAEAFGSVDATRYNLTALLGAQMRLLRWPDALATSDRLWKLRDRVRNPGLRASIDGYRARVLLALGRQSEAEAVLDAGDPAGVPPSLTRFVKQARAELAVQRGDPARTFVATREALAIWSNASRSDAGQGARVALAHQRASIAAGQPLAASIADAELDDGSVAIYRLVAEAEWAANLGDQDTATRRFREAAAQAETLGVPDTIALVAIARAYRLIGQGDISRASAVAGRVAIWADQDFDCALLQVATFHAARQTDAWARALRQAQALAGERVIPAALRLPPRR